LDRFSLFVNKSPIIEAAKHENEDCPTPTKHLNRENNQNFLEKKEDTITKLTLSSNRLIILIFFT
jgi:hypothetical protein